jgi:hypothetical protein
MTGAAEGHNWTGGKFKVENAASSLLTYNKGLDVEMLTGFGNNTGVYANMSGHNSTTKCFYGDHSTATNGIRYGTFMVGPSGGGGISMGHYSTTNDIHYYAKLGGGQGGIIITPETQGPLDISDPLAQAAGTFQTAVGTTNSFGGGINIGDTVQFPGYRNMWIVPRTGNNWWNPITMDGDFGIFWSDSVTNANTRKNSGNANAGFVIAPADTAGGIRVDASGSTSIGNNSNVAPTFTMNPLMSAHEIISTGYAGSLGVTQAYQARAWQSGTHTAQLHVYGMTWQTGHYNYTSDKRLKTEIARLESGGALDKIIKLDPVLYEWNELSQQGGMGLGFFAQEVEKIIPEAVMVTGDGVVENELSLNYNTIFTTAVGAIKDLNNLIEEKDEKIKFLEERLKAIEEKLGL